MSEFKYACPVCGQHIKCDSTQAGTTMECPTCFQKIVVPQAPASSDQKFILHGTKVGAERPLPAAVVNAPAAPAPAPEKGFPWPAIVFGILVFAAVLGVFAFHSSIFKPAGKPVAGPGATNRPGQPVAPTNPAVVASSSENALWKLNLDDVTIPDSAATGYVHGKALVPERVILDGGTLTLRTSNPGPPDVGISIYLHANRSEDLAGQSVSIKPDAINIPWVNLRCNDEQGKAVTQTVKTGYALRIDFGQLSGNLLPGKIYLCTPDEQQSYIVGTFTAKIHKPKPPKPQ
jgi:DNA-directed RNA polymerase subunit RPC12/RpoP